MANLTGDSAAIESGRAGFWRAIGPFGRRALVTGIGAILSLSLGVGVATAFRLPQDMAQPVQPDAMTVQDELPSTAAARAYALANPPAYPMAVQTATDDIPPPDATPLYTMPADATPDLAVTGAAPQADQAVYAAPTDTDQDRADPPASANAPPTATASTPSPTG
jgi:hypothetical protein